MNKKMLTLPLFLLLIVLVACQSAKVALQPAIEPTAIVDSESMTATPVIATSQAATASPIVSASSTDFTLTSPDLPADGRLPVEYTCDGDGSSLALSWSGAPSGTKSYAVVMQHQAPETIHWYWVLYNIPGDVTSLSKNVSGIGTLGNNINNGLAEYSPPCSKGPGDKTYTYTVYALSAEPQITVPAGQVDRDTLLAAIKDITLASADLNANYARAGTTGASDNQNQLANATTEKGKASAGGGNPADGGTSAGGNTPPGGIPPAEAIAACASKAEKDACSFTSPKGNETGLCEIVQSQLACSPQRGPKDGNQNQGKNQPGNNQPAAGVTAYNIEQAISDKAQGMTISYDALASMTGDLGADSFFPPGKVADFWGFQYLRDNDPSQMGHAGDFLTSAAMNTLNNLTESQRSELVALATSQVSQINEYGYKRFVLIDAFRRQIESHLPSGTTGLDMDAIKTYSAELYQLDGEISFARAELYGKIINSFTDDQKAYFDAMKGKGMKEWPDVQEPSDIRGLDRDVKVAVMTYAADLYSWYAGSVEADVYFCPERHGTYFGSFYLKDIKAMSDPTYAIPTNLTGDLGETMLQKLSSDQAQLITGLVEVQKPSLQAIVSLREQISVELRKFLAGGTADKATVLGLMEQYGAYDGTIIYNMAMHFAQVKQSLSAEQQAELDAMRTALLGDQAHPSGAYLYSQAIPMPEIPDTSFLFK